MRHYYDLFQLAQQSEVLAMLQSEEYQAIKKDYDRVGREYFPKSYFYPEALRFATSEALFPPEGLTKQIGAEYEAQCRMLCYGAYPTWLETEARFLALRELL